MPLPLRSGPRFSVLATACALSALIALPFCLELVSPAVAAECSDGYRQSYEKAAVDHRGSEQVGQSLPQGSARSGHLLPQVAHARRLRAGAYRLSAEEQGLVHGARRGAHQSRPRASIARRWWRPGPAPSRSRSRRTRRPAASTAPRNCRPGRCERIAAGGGAGRRRPSLLRHAPRAWHPYHSTRPSRPADRLVAPALAMLVVLAARGHSAAHAPPNLWHLALFFVGAVAMRGAGSTYNDLVDRDIDAKVERTRGRPLPSGRVGLRAALRSSSRAGARRPRRAPLLQPLHHRARRSPRSSSSRFIRS